MIHLYGIANCDTVRKARAWLHAQGLPHEFHDLKKTGLPEGSWARWTAVLAWSDLINRKGSTWRQLSDAERASVSDTLSAEAMAQARPSLIRRPVVEWGDTVTVGFDAAGWAAIVGQ